MKTLQALAFGAALIATGNAQQSTYTGSDGLNDLAKKVGKYMGTATNAFYTSSINNDAAYMAELKNNKDWGMMTPESSMKMAALQPSRGKFNWGVSDQLVAMAKAQGMRMRCHVLLWYGSTPGWMNTGNNATMIKDMDDHITKVISHFGDDCYAWDVVNEIAGGSGGYSDNIWYKTIGPSFVAHAFRTADQVRKQLGLKVKLYYNDHSLEWGGAKTNWAVQLVKDLKAQGVPIDGMGFQGHFGVGGVPPQSTFAKVMKQFTDLGVEVALTEFDIRTDTNPTDAKKQQQKKDYAAAIGACAVTPKCVGVTVWNFDDKYSWVPEYLSPKEGYALPFLHQGDKLVRKIAYDGMVDGWRVGTPTSGPTSGPTKSPTPTSPATPPVSTVAPPIVGVPLYGQCGGLNYSGSTLCKEGTCKKLNDWYSQCV